MTGLWVDPTIPRFTRAELVAEMDATYGFSDGSFREYQRVGLVASPRRRWPQGKAGSEPALWSDNDRLMLRAVLELRQRHQIEVGGQFQLAGPCNFVVWSWVFWDGFVELDQTRRALRTWVTPQLGGGGPGRARSKTSMNKMARMAVEQVAAPGVPLKKRKQMALDISDKLWSDDLEGLRALKNKLHEIVDPDATGRWVGAPGARVDAAGELERLYLVHLGSEAVVTGDPPIPDSQFESARHIMRVAWAGYTAEQPRLHAQSTHPDMFTEPTQGYQMSRSSSSLLLILGEQMAGVPAGLGDSVGGTERPAASSTSTDLA